MREPPAAGGDAEPPRAAEECEWQVTHHEAAVRLRSVSGVAQFVRQLPNLVGVKICHYFATTFLPRLFCIGFEKKSK